MRRHLMWTSPAIVVWPIGSALQPAHGPGNAFVDLLSLLGFLGTALFVYLWWEYHQTRRRVRGLKSAYRSNIAASPLTYCDRHRS